MLRSVIALVLPLAACAPHASAPAAPPSMRSPSQTAAASPGVALHGDRFDVLVVDDGDGPGRPDGVLRLFAMPDGARSVELRQRQIVQDL